MIYCASQINFVPRQSDFHRQNHDKFCISPIPTVRHWRINAQHSASGGCPCEILSCDNQMLGIQRGKVLQLAGWLYRVLVLVFNHSGVLNCSIDFIFDQRGLNQVP